MPSQLQLQQQAQGQRLEDIIPKEQLDQLEQLTQQTEQEQKESAQVQQDAVKSIDDLNRLDDIVANITTMKDLERMWACGVDYIGLNGTEASDVLACWEAGEGDNSSNNNDD
jgi:phosphoenolpyruvate-protein kinase (PTS system EI component)